MLQIRHVSAVLGFAIAKRALGRTMAAHRDRARAAHALDLVGCLGRALVVQAIEQGLRIDCGKTPVRHCSGQLAHENAARELGTQL